MERRVRVKRLFAVAVALFSAVFFSGCLYVPDAVRSADGQAHILKSRPVPSFQLTVQNDRFPDGAELKLDGRTITGVPFGESRTVDLTPFFGNIEREADFLITGKSEDGAPRSCVQHYRFRADDTQTKTWILDAQSSGCGFWGHRSASRPGAVIPTPVPAIAGTIDIRNETAVAVRISEPLPDGRKKELLALSPGERHILNIHGEEISLVATLGDRLIIARRTFSFVSRAAPTTVVWKVRAEEQRSIAPRTLPQETPRNRQHCRPGDRTVCP